jgi:Rrf2 family cysteine metabolism transcriptional repressor
MASAPRRERDPTREIAPPKSTPRHPPRAIFWKPHWPGSINPDKIAVAESGFLDSEYRGRIMTLLSRKVDYALLILSYLHQHAGGGSAREIAVRFGLSQAFVANILKGLCAKGFVASHRGVKGGYALARAVQEIRLAEVMDALEDRFHLTECTRSEPGDGCAVMSLCPLKSAIKEVHLRIREVLSRVTLAELFREPPLVSGPFRLELLVAP